MTSLSRSLRRAWCCVIVLSVLAKCLSLAADPHPSLPPPVIPECLGVNIHFTDPKPGEMGMLAVAGFKWVRMDLTWAGTERGKGVYDFSAYDRPMQSTEEKPLAHWGGANDGVIHYPIKWDSIFLLDNVSRQPVEGEIYLSAPTLIY